MRVLAHIAVISVTILAIWFAAYFGLRGKNAEVLRFAFLAGALMVGLTFDYLRKSRLKKARASQRCQQCGCEIPPEAEKCTDCGAWVVR